MAVQYFKQAEVAGNSLATANLAARLITAGFAQEAVERLENAKQKHGKDVHRNVSLNMGRAAEAESDEETKVGEAVKRAGREPNGRPDSLRPSFRRRALSAASSSEKI